MSEVPAELWLTPHEAGYYDYDTGLPREPDAVRYVREDLVSEYPANVWVRANEHDNGCQATLGPAPDAVRYVRADLYEAALALAERRAEALLARLAVVRSWGEAPCLEPLGELGKVL